MRVRTVLIRCGARRVFRGTRPLLPTIVSLAAVLLLAGCERAATPTSQPADNNSTTQTASTGQGAETSIAQSRIDAATLRGKALYENRDATGAIDAFHTSLSLAPADPRARRNMARGLLRGQQFQRAAEILADLVGVERESAANHYLLGLARLHLNENDQAASSFEHARRIDPNNATVMFQLAISLRLDGDAARIRELLENVLAINPMHWSAHYQLANVLRSAGDQPGFQKHMLEFERISEQLPYTKRGAETLEECEYTQIEFGFAPLEPPPFSTDLTWRPAPLPGNPAGSIIGCIDADGDGEYELISQTGGAVRILCWKDGAYTADDTPLYVATHGADSGGSNTRPSEDWRWSSSVADFNNDGHQDVLLCSESGGILLAGAGGGKFRDITSDCGVDLKNCVSTIWMDFDHDGDLDLLITSRSSVDSADAASQTAITFALLTNLGNSRFESAKTPSWIPNLEDAPRVIPVDFDNDDARDLVLIPERRTGNSARPALWLRSVGLGEFQPVESPFGELDGELLAVADFDNDLLVDALVQNGARIEIIYSDGRRRQVIMLDRDTSLQATPIDADSDGWLDVMFIDASTIHVGGVFWCLYHNDGNSHWPLILSSSDESTSPCMPTSAFVYDVNRDSVADILFCGRGGSLALLAGPRPHNRTLRVNLTGTRSNRSGIGTRVEIRTPRLQLMRDVWQLPVEIGVGDETSLDTVRTAWTNGVVHNDLNVDIGKRLNVEEPFVAVGSCPYLYAWDGRKMQFITDLLGSAPLGLSLRRGVFVPADADEYVWVGDESRVVPRDGRFVVQIADELRELLYLDEARLVVVDHPTDTDVYPNDRIQAPPFPPSQLKLLGDRIALRSARDAVGNDCTAALVAEDGERLGPPELREPQLRGLAKPHSIELDFGHIADSRNLALALNGWILWGDASVNVASGQNPDLPFPFPSLEALVGDEWRPVSTFIGAPAGKPKRFAVDLDGALPPDTRRLRLSTAYEIYWDQIALYRNKPDAEMRVTPIDPVVASLSYRGTARQTRPRRSDPVTPDADQLTSQPDWRGEITGYCTRYGDVRELLSESDDRLVILNTGDVVTLEFAADVPPPAPGTRRDFFLWLVGWDKDSDHNVASGKTVEPLPFHGMDDQAYGKQTPPAPKDDWKERYNTRWIGR